MICGYFKSKNWNILFFYPLKGICEREYTLPMSQIHIIIPADKKASILRELDAIGINQATIYLNLDKIAGYLKGV